MEKKKKWIIVGVIFLIGVMTTVGVARSLEETLYVVEIVSPEQTTLASEVMLPGTLYVKNEQFVYYSPEIGQGYELLVEEGDLVEKGTPLIKYNSQHLEIEKEQYALSKEAIDLRLSEIKRQEDDVKKQKAELNKKKEDLKKRESELSKEIGKEEAKAMTEVENQQIEAEQRQIAMQEQQLAYERKLVDLELKQHQLQKRVLNSNEDHLTILSNIEGEVIIVNKTAETSSFDGTRLILHIVNKENFIVRANLSEYDSLVVKEGQQVKIQSDALYDEEWIGTVQYVAFSPLKDEFSVQYPITVQIYSKNIEKLRPGLQMILQITTEEKSAMAIPLSAVIQQGGTNYVFVVEDNVARKKEVELGITTGDDIEVIKGLLKDEAIIKEPLPQLADGMEVTVVD
ncbi:MAG: efflux RND transporter periplasmic adaptor subunit [Anaerobacillus sp.]|uniref:efflux RND transporter periplasmic adaptor subunit n=1 Tax=Anaerobacillus sp. TaxID=1872506 RepID=UPI00391C5CDE